jgi:hypothetical protein
MRWWARAFALHREKDRDNASVPTGHGVIAVPLQDAEVSPDLTDSERITAAVNRLLEQQPHGHHDSLWAGECAPGEAVSDVRVADRLVTVVLDGAVGRDCDLVDGAGRTSERVSAAPSLVVRRRT